MSAQRDPRANQKERTRAAIVEAAAKLMKGGAAPSVADAAAAAKVSRATAYRYFPTPEALHLEIAGVTPAYVAVEALVESLDGDDVGARVRRLVDAANAVTFADEPQMRLATKVYQEVWFAGREAGAPAPTVREGRRMRWLDRALAPAAGALTPDQQHRLKAALALTLGAEAMIVMKDVCKVGNEEAQDVLRWAAEVLLEAGLCDGPRQAMQRRAKPK